jgi:SAM-dependent methyltransferase
MDERIATNRRRWDEMAQLHVDTYGIDDVDRAGDHRLKPFEPSELGDLRGLRICHLQCHIGGDSFALAQLGATVVGVDFSETSIEIARSRAERVGLADRVEFVCATVDDAPGVAGTGFDAVYTSWGVLCWLPDLDRWASVIRKLLAPGGWLYVAETHPYATTLRWPRYAYGGGVASFKNEQGDYTDAQARFEHPEAWEWSHGIGDVVTALAAAALRIEWLHEHAECAWHLNDEEHLVQGANGMWSVPGSTLPLSFSLRATAQVSGV